MGRYNFTSEQRKLLEGLAQPLAIYQFVNKRVVTLVLSDGFCKLFGYEDRAQAYYDMDNDMYKDAHPDDVARIADAAFRFATEGGAYEAIYRSKVKDGDDYRIVHAMGEHVYTEDGVRLAHVWYTDEGVYSDEDGSPRTELNRAFNDALHEESLVHATNYDYLTGLPSMTHFFEIAEAGRRAIQERGGEPTLLFMDLGGMKFFNEKNGFATGDQMLREFAGLLRSTFSNEYCCRIGSDHFAAFSEEAGLLDVLGKFFLDCRDINNGNSLPVRVGIYANRMGDAPVSTACDRAKLACDSLRDTYGSCYAYYDSNLLDKAERRLYVLANLDRALDEGWIQVYYQPIVRAVSGKVCDEEALSRWLDPELGQLTPADFIPAIEDAGMIYKLDLYVLDRALDKMKRQAELGLAIVPISINLSRSDFTSCDIVEEIRTRVDAAGIGHDKITIEITESTVGSDAENMKRQVERFHDLGFPVWMDDFGSGYSSIDLLQSMNFDLVKFDMSFMKRLDESDGAKIVLTELMEMAAALGIETLCEGVETEEQARFLREIGCSKLQGYYFNRAIPFEEIVERYEKGVQIGFEDPEDSPYFEAIGRVSLYDLAMMENEGDKLLTYANTLPMCVMEIDGENIEYVRTNKPYRGFMKRYFELDLEQEAPSYPAEPSPSDSSFMRQVVQCCESGGRAFFDGVLPDGSAVHVFIRRVGTSTVTGKVAAAVAVLSVSDDKEGATYADIARALAADYRSIYYVDLDTEKYIEYSSQAGSENLAMEQHSEDFFESARRYIEDRVYEGDRERILASFTKESITQAIDEQGAYTMTYRRIDGGEPVYVSAKAIRVRTGNNRIIFGVSVVDQQMKQQESFERMQRERDVLKNVAALFGNYLSVYSIDPETGRYVECSSTGDYEVLGLAKEGEEFFERSIANAKEAICPEDLPRFLERFTEENILREIDEDGAFNLQYRLMLNGKPTPVALRIAKVEESGGERLVAGVRPWQMKQSERDKASEPTKSYLSKQGARELVAVLEGENDIVRIVDPVTRKVLFWPAEENSEIEDPCMECNAVWSRDQRCTNCTSLEALRQDRCKFKVEVNGGRTFWIRSRPLVMDGMPCVLETVNDVTDGLMAGDAETDR